MLDLGLPTYHYRAYIDESGDEGFKFGKGSSDWFVIAAAITPDTEEVQKHLASVLDGVRLGINEARGGKPFLPPKKPLHFRDLKHEERRYFAQNIGQSPCIRTVTVLVYKPLLDQRIFRRKGNRLFHYATRLLVERISWCCRDWAGLEAEARVRLVFSSKGGLKAKEIAQYLNRLETQRRQYDYRGVANVDSENTLILTSGRAMGLQFADAVASSYFFAVQETPLGTEPCYVEYIHHLAYASQGRRVFRNGLKVFPREAEAIVFNNPLLQKIIADPGP